MDDHLMAEAPGEARDHVDRFLEKHAAALVGLDLSVEGIVDRIAGISRRLQRTMDETLAEFDLSYAEWKLLTTLRWREPPRSSPGELARALELSSGAMTNRLDRMEESGLIRRLPDPEDRRGIQVELTEQGLATWQRAAHVQGEREALIAAALDQAEKEALNDLLRRLMLELERREGKDRR
jgi:DNA-binding MarR family transcriptional regulator